MAMAAPIQRLSSLCRKLFRFQYGQGLTPDVVTREYLAPIEEELNKIRAEDINFNWREIEKRDERLQDQRAPVTYMHLLQEDKCFTMALFIMKEDGYLPLHDHPGMHGLLKVIHGEIKMISYSEPSSDSKDVSQAQMSHQGSHTSPTSSQNNPLSKVMVRNKDRTVTSEDHCCVLSPSNGNIHEIRPLTKTAAFLDILVPPYEDAISCHYFREEGIVDGSSRHRWLVEVPQPDTYWCDTVPYKGPPLD